MTVARSSLCCAGLIGLTELLWLLGCSDPTTSRSVVGQDSLRLTEGFSTYLGGSDTEIIRDVVVDSQGFVYLAGGTSSTNFPTTPGVFGPAFHAGGTRPHDAFVTKLSPTGQVIWSTVLGGPEYDRIYGMEVDELGFVYVAGRAGPGFPVTAGALQTTFGGSINPGAYGPQDGFVCKLKPDGTQVVFCTYFGNRDYEPIRDIAIDANHDIYVGTSMLSTDSFPSVWFANAFQKTPRGGRDALVAKIRGDGSRVEWATLIGGANEESNGITVRVDASGVYAATTTKSPDMPVPNGFGQALVGASDTWVGKLSLDGSRLIYGTYVGGSGEEVTETHHLAVDSHGNAFLAVGSTAPGFPVSAGAFQPAFGGQTDQLVVKVAPGGSLAAATFIGGSGFDWAEGVAVDPAGNLYFSGFTNSPDYPLTGGQGAQGGNDAIAAVMSPDLSRLLFSRRTGGSQSDAGRAADVHGSLFVAAGSSDSRNWPLAAALQSALGGGLDGVVAAFRRTP